MFFLSFTISVLVIFITRVPCGLTTGKDPLRTRTIIFYFSRLTGELTDEGVSPNSMFSEPARQPCDPLSRHSHMFAYGSATRHLIMCFSTSPQTSVFCIFR